MALKVYKKAPVKIQEKKIDEIEIKIEPEKPKIKKQLTLWDILLRLRNDLIYLLQTSTIARILIPSILIVSGLYIISRQIYPTIKYKARELSGYYNPTTAELVKGDSIKPQTQFLSNPGSEYFRKLTQQAEKEHAFIDDPVSRNYKGKFSISIPSLNLYDLPVTANVNSGVEEVYRSILKNSLAHFAGTGLPISDVKSNIVIYSHSAGGDYYQRTKDIAASFTVLGDIKIGDKVTIKIEGKEYNFKIVKTKIVKPNDTSIITGQKGKRTLTLFTCYPPGDNDERFVAVAREI